MIRQTHPHLLPEQHWTRLLVLLMALITGILTDGEEIPVQLGGSVVFNFKVTEDMSVTLAECSRCSSEKVFVFSPQHGLSVLNDSYTGRLFVKSNHSVMLERLRESDFGTYCCKLTTFPKGSLQRQIKLVKMTPEENEKRNGLFLIAMISVGCGGSFILLCGIIAGVVCYKKKRSLNSALDPGGRAAGQKKAKSKRTQSEVEEKDDDNYLNVS